MPTTVSLSLIVFMKNPYLEEPPEICILYFFILDVMIGLQASKLEFLVLTYISFHSVLGSKEISQ
jgi:hypothetical protein